MWCIRLILVVVLSVVTACSGADRSLPEVTATFVKADGSETEPFQLEVAATESERQKGLMFRREMSERHGMVFLFPNERINSFWMKNTILSLDMLFVDSSWKIVGILHRVPPQNEAPRSVSTPSQYVIELGAGVAERYGISEGAKVAIEGALPSVR